MSKYQKLDALILAVIDDKPKRFSTIYLGDIARESERIAKEEGVTRSSRGAIPWRIVDRRLQALRKAGKIRSTSTGWVRV
ncbi:hypothetical protein BGV72_31555 [Burkholderia ubonensis]|uniref:hypothetical protein n=1 Tax=Burkholderia ubonensis TaxID=101571 RepID=UPI0008FD98E1|nr:hypothetical protein [Burkholderia ubonensis]OJA71090.1 hypothetical protein BGV72_31555 [Burkholderia ubonensis]